MGGFWRTAESGRKGAGSSRKEKKIAILQLFTVI
jgi:hypothetical protein